MVKTVLLLFTFSSPFAHSRSRSPCSRSSARLFDFLRSCITEKRSSPGWLQCWGWRKLIRRTFLRLSGSPTRNRLTPRKLRIFQKRSPNYLKGRKVAGVFSGIFRWRAIRRRAIWWGVGFTLIVIVVAVGHGPFLRAVAAVLVTEDRLEPAAAIVVLAGHTPFREIEAARLYQAGWAPRLVLVKVAEGKEQRMIRSLGISLTDGSEVSREVLLKLGVPASAIVMPKEEVKGGTLEELQVVLRALKPDTARVILVTSKLHTRRARLTWNYLTRGRSPGIVRSTRLDPFDPNHWWQQRGFALAVVREYLGLLNYWVGFPVAP